MHIIYLYDEIEKLIHMTLKYKKSEERWFACECLIFLDIVQILLLYLNMFIIAGMSFQNI